MANAEDLLIALDDGHGIDTAGKRTPVVKELGRAIKVLVAPTDVDTSLNARTNSANSNL